MDPFSLLEVPRAFVIDEQRLESNYRALQKALHPDRHMQGGVSERKLSLQRAMDVNEAYRLLKDPLRRAEALLVAADLGEESDAERENRTSGGALMFEMMELQEALSDAKAGSPEQRAEAAAQIEQRYQQQLQRLADAFDSHLTPGRSGGAVGDGQTDDRVGGLVDGLRYLTRLRDEARRLTRSGGG